MDNLFDSPTPATVEYQEHITALCAYSHYRHEMTQNWFDSFARYKNRPCQERLDNLSHWAKRLHEVNDAELAHKRMYRLAHVEYNRMEA